MRSEGAFEGAGTRQVEWWCRLPDGSMVLRGSGWAFVLARGSVVPDMAFLARTAISGNPIAGAIGEAYNSMCSHVRVLGDAPRPRRRTARNRAGV